ncbi:AGAP000277-PA-like protein [Anopheles sinensis]|uniref:AGAP000277-PA-like protein n=1 Tax=Anopheles sinensis TaxID=74873 RepID=A0A084VNW4_ANOSI|nr:AGAP000277-PA-like protein [Anopheles sinensis]
MSRKAPREREGGGGQGKLLSAALSGNNPKGGAMIMKSVSIFLASGRRASAQSRDPAGRGPNGSNSSALPRATVDSQSRERTGASRTGTSSTSTISRDNRKILARMDELNGKLNPKMLEMYKRRTHFSK